MNEVTYQHQGRTYTGTYTVSSAKVVTTTCAFGKKATPVGQTQPVLVARWLLGDMVRDANPMK